MRASLDDKTETGRLDFVDDLANVAPAVVTLAMLGIPLKKWAFYSDPIHALVFTPEDSPEMPAVIEQNQQMAMDQTRSYWTEKAIATWASASVSTTASDRTSDGCLQSVLTAVLERTPDYRCDPEAPCRITASAPSSNSRRMPWPCISAGDGMSRAPKGRSHS